MVNSIVAVSQSTARDVVKDYKQHVFKVASDQFQDKEDGDKMPETSGSIVSAIQNRLSRNLFKGPATADQILQFRKHYKIWSSSNPIHEINGVPYDFLLTVGTDYPYKNYGTFFAALDLLADDVLDRISIVMVGRGGMNGDEFNQMKRHPVHVYSDGHKEERKAATVSSQVPLRVHVLSYIEEKDLPVVYSGEYFDQSMHISTNCYCSCCRAGIYIILRRVWPSIGRSTHEWNSCCCNKCLVITRSRGSKRNHHVCSKPAITRAGLCRHDGITPSFR